jgi:hypothetical protein
MMPAAVIVRDRHSTFAVTIMNSPEEAQALVARLQAIDFREAFRQPAIRGHYGRCPEPSIIILLNSASQPKEVADAETTNVVASRVSCRARYRLSRYIDLVRQAAEPGATAAGDGRLQLHQQRQHGPHHCCPLHLRRQPQLPRRPRPGRQRGGTLQIELLEPYRARPSAISIATFASLCRNPQRPDVECGDTRRRRRRRR